MDCVLARRALSRLSALTTHFPLTISTIFCRASWSRVAGSTTRWACMRNSTRAWLSGSIPCARGFRRGVHSPHEFVALDHLLHDMRLFKSRGEISAMRKSAKVAVAAHKRAMQVTRPGMYEYEVEAEFRHEFRRTRCLGLLQPDRRRWR